MQVAFSDDNRYIYVTRVTSDNGDIVTKLSKYDISGDGTELWTQTISDCVSLADVYKRQAIDCANGSASATAESLFYKFGAEYVYINNEPDGLNINDKCVE